MDTDLPYNMAAQFCGDPELFTRKLRMFLFWCPDLRYVLVFAPHPGVNYALKAASTPGATAS